MGDLSDIGKDNSIQKRIIGLGFTNTAESVKPKKKQGKRETYTRWSSEMDSFLLDVYTEKPTHQIRELIKQKFGVYPTPMAIRERARILGVTKICKWTPEMDAFVLKYADTLGIEDTVELLNSTFGCARTKNAVVFRVRALRGPDEVREPLVNTEVQKTSTDVEETPQDTVELNFPVRKKRKNVLLRIFDAIFLQ